jgi:alginate O-acetyltransferase complex protein AlgI
MVFDSVSFWLFLLPVLAAWWLAPWGASKGTALLASCVFYGWWDPFYLLLILASALVDFFVAQRIAACESQQTRRRWLAASLGTNLGLLALFKYTPLVARDLGRLVGHAPPPEWFDEWVVPVGISFYTFQTLSYSLDVYRGRLAPTRSFREFFLYVALFPQLVAGPIVRARTFLPQLEQRPRWSTSRFELGLYRCIQGLFLKVVVADNLAPAVERVFEGDIDAFSSAAAWIATIAFGGQIFADFAGYSGIAIGVAMMMGLRFPENFRAPYISAGLSEFWTRWHITLSSWLRDYLYIPLGGNRRGNLRTHVNLALTMLLGGLWHGASWTFVAWGGLHGLGLSIERWLRGDSSRQRRRGGFLRTAAAMVVVYVFVHVTWVFFRAQSFDVAWRMLTRMFVAPFTGASGGAPGDVRHLVLLAPIALLHIATLVRERCGRDVGWLGRAVAAGLMLAALFVVRRGTVRDFVYFQF